MSQWQILDENGVPTGDVFDDGLLPDPGEADFSTEAVRAHVGPSGAFNCIGRSPKAHAEREAQLRAEAEAEQQGQVQG